MRCDQFVGLNDWASNFVNEPSIEYTDYVRRVYKDGSVEDLEVSGSKRLVEVEKYDETYGMFEDPYPLNKYTFPDGRVFFEYEQASPWSSGPVMFIALKDEQGNPVEDSLWPDEAINEA